MSNILRSSLIFVFIFVIQALVHIFFLRPVISTWGATEEEVNMPLAGDHLAPYISSTRAITINAPMDEVWKWMIQIGADRGGFFSYEFLEKLIGYEAYHQDKILPEDLVMEVGRIIPVSPDESKTLIKYDFEVISVDPGKSFVIKNWGVFEIKKINAQKTRLFARTHGQKRSDLKSEIDYYFGMPHHYIMERRMLMGIKARVEAGAGAKLSSTEDVLWFLGIVLSALGIAILVFIGRSIQGVLLSAIFGVLWLWPLFVFDPQPIYSFVLLLMVVLTSVWFFLKNRHYQQKTK